MQSKTIVSLLAVAVVGVVVGYLLQGFLRRGEITVTDPPPLVETSGGGQKFTEEEQKGWCCPAKGQQCAQSPSDIECLGGGGYAFAYEEEECRIVCAPAAP